MRRLRPISLEFGARITDHRVVLNDENDHIEPTKPDLGESIDELLDELDASHADREVVDSDLNEEAVDEVEDTEDPAEDQVASDVIETLESVGDSTESLLGESIDALLEDVVDDEEPDEHFDVIDSDILDAISDEPNEPEAEIEFDESVIVDDAVEAVGDEDDLEAIEDMLESVNADLTEVSQEADQAIESELPETETNELDADDVVDAVDEAVEETGELKDVEDQTEESVADIEAMLEGVAEETQVDEVDEVDEDLIESMIEEANETRPDDVADVSADGVIEEVIDDIVEETIEDIAEELIESSAIEDSVDELLDEETEAEEAIVEESPPKEDAEAVEAIEETSSQGDLESMDLGNLDDEIASLGDDLLMGDFETPEGELVEGEDIDPSIDPALLLDQLDLDNVQPIEAVDAAQAPVDDAATSEIQEAPSEVPAQSPAVDLGGAAGIQGAAESVPAPVDPAPQRAVPAATEKPETFLVDINSGEAEILSIWQKLMQTAMVISNHLHVFSKVKAGPIVARGILFLSKPLASKPAEIRNSVGWIALWTLFLACMLWGYALFFRTTTTTIPMQAPSRVIAPGESLEPIQNQLNMVVEP